MTAWSPATGRYDGMIYDRCGRSGLRLPAIALGLWHNFGGGDSFENGRAMVRRAVDLGITHIDLANNYGPPPGSAEEAFGRMMAKDLRPWRDELVVSTKAGYEMWARSLRRVGSRKYLLASLDQSLERMGLDYVDIFYSHRFDPDTPLEETMGALDQAVRSGRALYAGISSYTATQTAEAAAILADLGTPCLIHQPSYSMLNRWIEPDGLLDTLEVHGIGCIVFSPLAQGMLTDRYLSGIPADSRVAKGGALRREFIRPGRHRGHHPARPNGKAARPEPRPDGARLGAARQPRHHRPDWRQQHCPDRQLHRGTGQPVVRRLGTCGNRPADGRERADLWSRLRQAG